MDNKETKRLRSQKWREDNREKHRAYQRQYRLEHKEECAARNRQWALDNPNRVNELHRKSRRKNPESYLEITRRYRASHPGFAEYHSRKRRALKRGAEGEITRIEWLLICAIHGNVCACCGLKKKLTLDHVIPLSKGGMHSTGNAQPLCRSCNSKKGTLSTDYRKDF